MFFSLSLKKYNNISKIWKLLYIKGLILKSFQKLKCSWWKDSTVLFHKAPPSKLKRPAIIHVFGRFSSIKDLLVVNYQL